MVDFKSFFMGTIDIDESYLGYSDNSFFFYKFSDSVFILSVKFDLSRMLFSEGLFIIVLSFIFLVNLIYYSENPLLRSSWSVLT